MKLNLIGATMAACVMALVSTSAHAADCNPSKTLADDMTADQAQAVYDCLKDGLYKGYNKNAGKKKGDMAAHAKDYRGWTQAAKFPAAPGFHGSRFLMTWVNSVGAEEYLKYKDENVNIPAGTVIAKESFKIGTKGKGKGKARKGPLFLMIKAEAGSSPKTMDWIYQGVLPNGKPMKFNPVKACSKCHMENFSEQGGLGYPVEEARIGN